MKTETAQNATVPFISLFHHKHGVSVAVNQTGQKDADFWAMDGYEPGSTEAENEWFERYELPSNIVKAVNSFEGLLYACRLALNDKSRWETPEDHVVQEVLKVAIAKAEAQ